MKFLMFLKVFFVWIVAVLITIIRLVIIWVLAYPIKFVGCTMEWLAYMLPAIIELLFIRDLTSLRLVCKCYKEDVIDIPLTKYYKV